MGQGDLGTVDWRVAFELFERWQAAPPEDRPAALIRLAGERPELATALQALVRADAVATRDPAGLSLALPEGDRTGATVGAWRLERLLGAGGMGEVWLASRNDALHQGQAAIKLLQSHQRSPAAQARFAAEARLLARLAHPHIARLLDVGIDASGQRHLVLEYVAGEPIDRWCAARDAPVAARLRLFLQVCDAVAHAHAQLVVHRDLKPSNILVDAQGQAKLLDFGVAKLLDDSEEGLTRTGLAALTPEYAAPEQLSGEPVTVATDVYALGVLLFELLSGERPYVWAKSSPLERLRDVLETEPRQLSRVAPAPRAAQLRGDLDHIVARALQREPRDRYASVRALADDVQRHLAHEPVLATAPTWRYRAGKFLRRHRSGVAAAGIVGVTLLTGTAAALWQAQRATAEAAKANATRAFLLDLFRTVKVGEADLRANLERPARDLLLQGGRRLLADRALAPEVRLDLLSTIATLNGELSLLDDVEAMQREVLGITIALHGSRSAPAVDAMQQLAATLDQLGKGAEARALQETAIEAAERAGVMGSTTLVRLLYDAGQTAFYVDRNKAQSYFERAAQIASDRHPGHAARLIAHVGLMRLHGMHERFDLADREAERIRALARSPSHRLPFNLFSFERRLAERWTLVGEFAAARAALERAAPLGDASMGPRHPQVVATMVQLALMEQQLGSRDRARSSLAAIRKGPRDNAVWTEFDLDRAAATLAFNEGALRDALEASLSALHRAPDQSYTRAWALLGFARAAALAGWHTTAIAVTRLAEDEFSGLLGPKSVASMQALAARAEALLAAADHAGASPAFEALLAWADARASTPTEPLVGRLRARALIGLSSLGLLVDPEAALRRALQAQAGRSTQDAALDDRLLWAAARVAQAQALKALGQRDEAGAVAASAVLQLQHDQVPESPRLVAARLLATPAAPR